MEIKDFYKEVYFRESDRRDKVRDEMNIPIAFGTALLSYITILFTNYDLDFKNFGITDVCFYLFLLSGFILLLNSFWFLIKAFNSPFQDGHKYSEIPTPDKLNTYHHELITYYEKKGNSEKANEDYLDYLIQTMNECSANNAKVNDTRLAQIHQSRKRLIISLAILFITSVFFSINYSLDKENVQKVEIVN